jgi:hypothetical protein
MLFDTDILIWLERGNKKAAQLIDESQERFISIFSYMEWLQGAISREHSQLIQEFIKTQNFRLLPLTENIGHRASVYIEEYSLSHGLSTGDAIIAATAAEHHIPLASGNEKHFKAVRDVKLKVFRH